MDKIICYRGKHLQLSRVDDWEFVERPHCTGVVIMVTVTTQQQLVLIEQFRPAVGQRVLEFPAGLVGDDPNLSAESMQAAASRELLEETGYSAEHWEALGSGPPSSGQSNEIVSFYYANPVHKKAKGGGVGSERITVHPVNYYDADDFINAFARNHGLVAIQVYAGLHLIRKRVGDAKYFSGSTT